MAFWRYGQAKERKDPPWPIILVLFYLLMSLRPIKIGRNVRLPAFQAFQYKYNVLNQGKNLSIFQHLPPYPLFSLHGELKFLIRLLLLLLLLLLRPSKPDSEVVVVSPSIWRRSRLDSPSIHPQFGCTLLLFTCGRTR